MCTPSICQDEEGCTLLNGATGCHKGTSGICTSKGDHHYPTYNGRYFVIYGNCTYLLTSHCPSWRELDDFTVEGQNQIKHFDMSE